MTKARLGRRVAGAAFALLASAVPALAHPHIFIDAKVTVVFNEAGQISGLRNAWTFDKAFSVWMIQGLDTNGDRVTSPEEMQELADENMMGLADFGFYTFAGSQDDLMEFSPAGDQRMEFAEEQTTLSFSLLAAEPRAVDAVFELGVYDPEYYVAISVDEPSDVVLENAPEGCAVALRPPVEMSEALQTRL